jgi:hypothetical protein
MYYNKREKERRKRVMAMEREHFDKGERWVLKQQRLTIDEIKNFELKSLKLEGTFTTNRNLQPKKFKHNVQIKDQKNTLMPSIVPCFITCTPMNNRSIKSLSKKKCKKKLQAWQ